MPCLRRAPRRCSHSPIRTAALSSLADPTPEGTSIVELSSARGITAAEPSGAVFVPFTAQTRMSGLDLADGTQVRKGAGSAVAAWLEASGVDVPAELHTHVTDATDAIAQSGGTPLVVARIRALTRRIAPVPADASPVVRVGDATVDLVAHAVTRGADARAVRLTPTEWRVLEFLVRNPGRLVTRQTLLTEIWGSENIADTGYLRLYIAQLRKKLEDDPAHPVHLLTESGVGYRFVPDE